MHFEECLMSFECGRKVHVNTDVPFMCEHSLRVRSFGVIGWIRIMV